ncbi:MAG: hypothetical protein JOY76_05140 [Hyphomicrobiales bacterium]|nr:hypothetical protein [Hyphomicrobiales bacterium]
MSIAFFRGKGCLKSGTWRGLAFAALGLFAFVSSGNNADAASRTRFWNLTTGTIKEFRLAPAGSTSFGKNQCENDPDAAVDHDERLEVTGVGAGRYDAKIVFASGKACMARGIELKEGKVFSIDDHDLVDCK